MYAYNLHVYKSANKTTYMYIMYNSKSFFKKFLLKVYSFHSKVGSNESLPAGQLSFEPTFEENGEELEVINLHVNVCMY